MLEIHSGLASESLSIVYFDKFNKLTGPASDQKNIARLFLEKKILPYGSVASLYVTNVTSSPFESLFNGPGDINSCDTDLQLPRCDG